MRIKTILKIAAAVMLIAVVAVAVILKSMDFNKYRGMISQEVHKATGRKLEINGELDLKLSLNPALTVNDVTFANAEWGSRPEMVKIKRLEIVVNLLPLIFGDIRIKRFVLIEPDILLETDAKGRGNWILGKVEKPAAKPDPSGQTDKQDAIIPLVNEVRIKNAALTYRDGRTQKTIKISLNSFKARSADLQSPFYLDIDGAYNKYRFEVKAKLGPLAQLINPTGAYPVHLEAQALGTEIKVDGTVKKPMEGKGVDLTISVKGKELTKLVELAELPQLKGKPVPQIGPFDIAAHVTDQGEKLSVTDIKVVVGKSDFVLIKVNGDVKNALEGKGLDLELSAEGSDLAKVSKLADVQVPLKGSFQVAAHLTDPSGTYLFKRLQVRLGKSNLAGDVAVKIKGKRPLIDVSFTSLNLDLNKFKAPVRKKVSKKKKSGQAGKSQKKVFNDEPFPIEALQTVDAIVKISNGRILFDGLELKDLLLDMNLKDGNLVVRPLKVSIAGGSITIDVSINSRQSKKTTVKAKMDIKKIDITRLLKDMKVTNLLSSGKVDLKVDLHGRGDSLRTLMAGLNGNISLVMEGGKIENKYVDFIAADLVKLVVPGAMEKDYTVVNCFVSRFDIKNGLAENTGFLFDTDNITVAGDGNIDLATEKLNLGLNPKPKHASLLSIAVPLNIRGTLAEPSIKLDKASVAKKVVGGFLGTLINPIGILIPLVSKGTGNENPCLLALSQSKKTATTKTASQPKQEEKKPAVQNALESIGKGLGGLFK